jgi:NADPH2:quinone reductase
MGGIGMKAIRVHEVGGPEKLVYEEVPLPNPGPNQARVRIKAIGLNFIDVYFRTGLYQAPLPIIPGMEAAGIVESVGDDVSGVSSGDRVAYAMSMGAYADAAVVDEWRLIRLPDNLEFEKAAAAMLQGMTAHYLTHSTFPLRAGQTTLVHAAAGGVGLLLVQIAKTLGARVIGTVSSEPKANLAREAGADHIILYDKNGFEKQVEDLTDGAGVEVVYDSVGRSTFESSLNCLCPRGILVLFGQSSGPVPPVDLNILNAKGSLFVTRPSLAHYANNQSELEWRSGDVLKWVSQGRLHLRIDRSFSLADVAEAHQALESRKTAGKVILIP